MSTLLQEQPARAADPMVPRPFVIEDIQPENFDTTTVRLRPADGAPIPAFRPGQFNMLYVFGVGEAAISISGDATQTDTLVHTFRSVGSVTRLLQNFKPGDTIGIRGAFGNGWPLDQTQGKDLLIVAGGIGLAPLRPLIYHFVAHRTQISKFIIFYGARTPNDLLYAEELKNWRARFDMQVGVTVDRSGRDWLGTVGVVTNLIPRARFDPDNTIALVCGPEIMMQFAIQELTEGGLSEQNIYLSMERNMRCAISFCGHCQYGPHFICRDGPVFPFSAVKHLFYTREI